jgi:long-chain acyl-CoA synthetase
LVSDIYKELQLGGSMEGTKKQVFTIQVQDGKPGKDGQPAVGPVFRNILAKDGYPPLEPDMKTSWDVFR